MRIRLLALLFTATLIVSGQNAASLVRQSVQLELEAKDDARDYTYRYTEIERALARNGIPTSTRTKTYEVLFLYGRQFTRLISDEGNPKAAAEVARDNHRFEKAVASRARMTPAERESDGRRQQQNGAQRLGFIAQIPDLYDFRLLREEELRGRPSWVIAAAPRKDAHPRGFFAGNLSHLSGTIWIDKADGRWAKVEAIAPQNIKFGPFVANVHQGSCIVFEQTKVNGDVWLPSRIEGTFSARLGFSQVNLQSETTYFDYRRFQSASRIVSAGPAR